MDSITVRMPEQLTASGHAKAASLGMVGGLSELIRTLLQLACSARDGERIGIYSETGIDDVLTVQRHPML